MNLAELVDTSLPPATRRAAAAGDAGLADAAELGVRVLTDATPASQTGLHRLLDALGVLRDPINVLVGGAADALAMRRSAPDGVYFVDESADLRPLLAAAQLVAIPAADDSD